MYFRIGPNLLIVEYVKINTRMVNAFWNGFECRCSSERELLHSADKCKTDESNSSLKDIHLTRPPRNLNLSQR